MKKKGENKSIIWIVLIVAAAVGAYFYFTHTSAQPNDMVVLHYFDKFGNEIRVPNTQSVVNGISGVSSVLFEVSVVNLQASLPMTAYITTGTSPELYNAITHTSSLAIANGGRITWNSSLIPVSLWEGTTKSIIACVNGTWSTSTGILSKVKCSSAYNVIVAAEQGADFTVTVNGPGGSGEISPTDPVVTPTRSVLLRTDAAGGILCPSTVVTGTLIALDVDGDGNLDCYRKAASSAVKTLIVTYATSYDGCLIGKSSTTSSTLYNSPAAGASGVNSFSSSTLCSAAFLSKTPTATCGTNPQEVCST
jgi:hypothetical protein